MNVLGLFAKWPRPGAVKTRLAAQTSPDFAARVAMAFLLDSLERYGRWTRATRMLVFAPREEEANFARVAGGWQLEPQCDGDLGNRLHNFFARQFERGSQRVVAIGTDSPTLTPTVVPTALDLILNKSDVVIGPATDGGYYLIGMKGPRPELFTGINWSGPDVLEQTIARLDPALIASFLAPWYDVDTLNDWRMLRGHLAAIRRHGHEPGCPRTEALARSGEFCEISGAL
jgi:rSAM/selenodomain-associated transferase 1